VGSTPFWLTTGVLTLGLDHKRADRQADRGGGEGGGAGPRAGVRRSLGLFLLLTLHIIQLTPRKLSAEHKSCTGANDASSGQKTKGCIEGEDPAEEDPIWALCTYVLDLRRVIEVLTGPEAEGHAPIAKRMAAVAREVAAGLVLG